MFSFYFPFFYYTSLVLLMLLFSVPCLMFSSGFLFVCFFLVFRFVGLSFGDVHAITPRTDHDLDHVDHVDHTDHIDHLL